jgi:mannose-1-phosphate guanylyltransferase
MLYAVIMAGGSGTRLWPESRRDRPKQLLNLQGDRSMIRATVDRLAGLVPPERVVIATTQHLAGKIQKELPQLPPEAILAEPAPRNTAPCIGLAADWIARRDPQATMAVMPADHVIRPVENFCEAIRFAQALVDERPERLVTFGIRPSYPSTSFGYIERDEPLATEVSPAADSAESGRPSAYRVKRFREKPAVDTARSYVDSGDFFWNAGIFLWKVRTILDCLQRWEPEIFRGLARNGVAADSPAAAEVLLREFEAMKKISIDYAVMERAADVVVIEAPFEWDDVGGWRAVERLRETDPDGNLIDAPRHLGINTRGTIVRSSDPDHVLATLGVENLIVIHTPDATLIANKKDEESIRLVIAELEERGWNAYL